VRQIGTSRPSPAFVVVVLALVTALAGTALAGTDALTRALTKSQVKKIVKKQADKRIKTLAPGIADAQITARAPGIADAQVTARAPGLSVASAASADTAATATQLGRVTVQRQDFDIADGTSGAATVSCPAGQQAIGGGVLGTTAGDDGRVVGSRPVSGSSSGLLNNGDTFDGWRGHVLNLGGATTTLSANVWVICAG